MNPSNLTIGSKGPNDVRIHKNFNYKNDHFTSKIKATYIQRLLNNNKINCCVNDITSRIIKRLHSKHNGFVTCSHPYARSTFQTYHSFKDLGLMWQGESTSRKKSPFEFVFKILILLTYIINYT